MPAHSFRKHLTTRALFLLILAAGTACSGKGSSGWSGELAVEEGVLHVRNPTSPVWGPEHDPFAEDEVLGGIGAPEDALMALPVGVARSADGRRFVLDHSDARVLIFDAEGRFLRSFGRKGEGPGEFMRPVSILIRPGEDLVIADSESGRVSRFDLDGVFLDSWRSGGSVGQLVAAGGAGYYLSETSRLMTASIRLGAAPDEEPTLLKRVGASGDVIGGFGEVREYEGLMLGIWMNRVLLAPLSGDSLIVNYTSLDMMEVWGPDGGLGRVIHRNTPFQPREPVEESVMSGEGNLRMRFEFDIMGAGVAGSPDGAYLAAGVALDPVDLRTSEEMEASGREEVRQRWAIDLFDRQGRWLARHPLGITLPYPCLDWHADGLYLISPDGDAAIHRLRLRLPAG